MTPQTARRLLAEISKEVVSAGGRGRVRHALRRHVHGTLADFPLFAIDEVGRAAELPRLSPIQPQGTLLALDGTAWPVPADSRDGWWDGLPYPVYAMRPAGYLGRRFARAEADALEVPEDPDTWTDDDILWALSRRGADVPGNLILGTAAFDLWQREGLSDPPLIQEDQAAAAYVALAAEAVATGGGGSSAAGEFPKFTAVRELADAATPHVLVKFSGGGGGASERRWGDLLVCEHLALEHVRTLPHVQAARSRVLERDGRVFLETERFDRVGVRGRRATCGLDAIEPAFLGARDLAWPVLAGRLLDLELLEARDVDAIEHLWWFGKLIANADMHPGNVSFHVDGTLRLAPAYDMLPMAYAPLAGGEVPDRVFEPALPTPSQRPLWLTCCAAATSFWDAASRDARISEAFRRTCSDNARRLTHIAARI